MKKLLSVVVLGALLLAACGPGSGALAATVDGEDITVSDVEALIDTDGAAITKEQFAQFLAFEIQWRIVNQAAATDFGLTITEEEVAAEADRIYENVAAEGQSREDFLLERGVTEEFLRNIARQGLLDQGIREVLKGDADDPTEDQLAAARDGARASLTTACVSHILVATEPEAQSVVDRLDDGEEFGSLAAELSQDPGSAENNGILPCGAPDQYVAPFREAVMAAPVGEVYAELVESQFGFHVILVTDRQEPAESEMPTDEELADGVKDEQILSELEEWFFSTVEASEVSVDEEYGVWQPNPPTVVPPAS